jgi:hypothetical protein
VGVIAPVPIPASSLDVGVSSGPPEAGAAADRILSTRRSAWILALTVFATTLIQVLVQPVAALIQGEAEWTLIFPPPVLLSLLVIACAVQAGSFLLNGRSPEATVLIVTVVYIALTVGLSIPTWLIGMYLVMALA